MPKLPANIAKTLTSAVRALEKEGKQERQEEETLIQKTRRRLRELYYGPETYLSRRRVQRAKRRVAPTVRTKAVVKKGLKPAGLTKAEIARLRGRK